jgi:hypothetical protein
MEIPDIIVAVASLISAIAAVVGAVFKFWREIRREQKKQPRK